MLTKSAALLLLPGLVAAQYGPPPPGPSPPDTNAPSQTAAAPIAIPSAPADTPGHINIDVAFQQTFTFHPNNVTASVGDQVTFWFPGSLAHSVTQSSFAAPCTYLAATSNTSAGFDSGLVTASSFTVNITDTQPIWFHCKQVTHCGLGMVGSINAPATGNTFDKFMTAALAIGSKEVTETDHGAVTGGLHAIATAAPSSDTGSGSGPGSSSPVSVTSPASSPTSGSSSSSSSGSSSGSSPGPGSGNPSSATKVVGSAGIALLSAALAVFLA